jgi:hypothetical protein
MPQFSRSGFPVISVRLTLKISGEHEMDDLDTLLISSAGS